MKPEVARAVRILQDDPSWPLMTYAEKTAAAQTALLDIGAAAEPVDVYDAVAAMDAGALPRPVAGMASVTRAAAPREEKRPGRPRRTALAERVKKARPQTRGMGPSDPFTRDSFIRRTNECTGLTYEAMAKIVGKSRQTVVTYGTGAARENLDRRQCEALLLVITRYHEGTAALIADLEERLRTGVAK